MNPESVSWSRRHFLRTLSSAVIAAGAGSFVAGADTEAKARAFRVKVAWIPNVEYAGYYLAQANGLFAAAGIEPELLPGGPNSQVVPLIASGRALIGLEAIPENVVNAVNAGTGLKIVGAQLQRSPESWISLAKAPVKTPKDIEGKRLGITLVGKNTALVFMRLNGVDTTKVSLVPIQYDAAPLAAGEIDALWGLAFNQPVALGLRGYPAYTMPLADFGFNRMQNVLFVTEETLADKGKADLVRRFLSASAAAWKTALDQPEKTASVIVDLFGSSLGLKMEEQSKILEAMTPFLARHEDMDKPLFWMGDKLVSETVTSLGRIGVRANPSMFTNSLIQ